MNENEQQLKERARQMLIDGKTHKEIRTETHLREKDIGRIQREITNRF